MPSDPILLAKPGRRLQMLGEDRTSAVERFRTAVEAGLTAEPKALPAAGLYDRKGSLLFERICELPEYYLWRAERDILAEHAPEIVACVPPESDLVELGSGNATKTAILIRAALERGRRLRYVPIDISSSALEASARRLLEAQPRLEVLGICAEYSAGLRTLSRLAPVHKLVLWLGSNAGNFERGRAAELLASVRAQMYATDRLLLGLDLRKDAGTLERAYDDAAGITARFEFNLLERINRELGGHFQIQDFRYRARYVPEEGRVEMGFVSRVDQYVAIDALSLRIRFAAGEFVHTEDSYKYSFGEIDDLARSAAFEVRSRWLDREHRFAVSLLAPR